MLKKTTQWLLRQKPIKWGIEIGNILETSAISVYSGQTAFFLMLSFFPYLLFLSAILRLTTLTEENFIQFLLTVFPSVFQSFIASLIHDIYSNNSTPVLSISIISAIWLGSKAFLSLARGINSMYRQKESRNFIVLRLFSFLYSILFAILIIAALALLVFGKWLQNHFIVQFPVINQLVEHIISFRILIALAVFFVFFLYLYRVLPNCKWKLKYHTPGALLASGGWLLFSYLYSLYVDHFSNYSSFYGAMTTIALLMVWLYACMYILFLGGIVNRLLYQKKVSDK